MRKKRILAVLCEDKQQSAFIRILLKKNYTYKIKSMPVGEGSGEQFVRNNYRQEVEISRRSGIPLLVMIDADRHTVRQRRAQLEAECKRNRGDKVAVLVPARNIETWIAFLDGEEEVDETKQYSRLTREKDCRPAARKLAGHCEKRKLPSSPPASLKAACEEWERLRSLL